MEDEEASQMIDSEHQEDKSLAGVALDTLGRRSLLNLDATSTSKSGD